LAAAIETQKKTVETLKGNLEKLKANDSPEARKIEDHIKDLENLIKSYKDKKPEPFVAPAFVDDYNAFVRANKEQVPLLQTKERFLGTTNEPGWFQVQRTITVGTGKKMQPATEILYGHVPSTLDGVKTK
jgi:hypothetical protein